MGRPITLRSSFNLVLMAMVVVLETVGCGRATLDVQGDVGSLDPELRRSCGNGKCGQRETCENCPNDCGRCPGCVPTTCADQNVACGVIPDGCGSTLDCGLCAPANESPVASASVSPTVQGGALVTLDGSASSDPDGDSLTFSWVQTAGPLVALSNASDPRPVFAAPNVTTNTVLSFELTVSDGRGASSRATASTTVVPFTPNRPPVASAGANQLVDAGSLVTLTGAGSSDPDGDPLTYQWTQTAGAGVTLSSVTSVSPTFVAPSPSVTATLTFSLVVKDPSGLASTPSTVTVTVNPLVAPSVTITKAVSLHSVTRSSIVVFFLTNVAVQATVEYGVASTSEQTFTEASASTRHVITLRSLSQDTRYVYTVRAGTATASGSFFTAMDYATNPKPFSFAVVGDARGHTTWTRVSNAILAKKPRFIVQTGDNNNDSGSATNWENYYNAGKALFAQVPVFAAQGNHDTGSNYTVYNIAPQSSSASDIYYAFVYGNAGFVAIDTNTASNTTQNTWVRNALTTLSGGPLFAFHHHPLYSCGNHGSSTTMQNYYKAMFESAKLTTDFVGHDHDLIYWTIVNGVRYVVSGGGGAGTYPPTGCQGPFAQAVYGFMIVEVDGANMVQSFYNDVGTLLYTTGTFTSVGPSVNFAGLGNLVVY